jgi:hypothetical protein
MNAGEMIAEAVAAADFGKASARKAGRDPRWPYVPIIDWSEQFAREGGFQQTEQIRGLAYATREEAVAVAEEHIERGRRTLESQLWQPRYRALRQHHGLPRELPGPEECPCENEQPDPCLACGASVAVGVCPADRAKQ